MGYVAAAGLYTFCSHCNVTSFGFLFHVSDRKRYNTLDFAEQNRVPTGCFSPLLETPNQGDIPIFSSQVGSQNVKMQFAADTKKMQKEASAHNCENANLPFGDDNMKLDVV